ncbi:MAG: 50S ribosomal protein L19 [Candidatus Wildermuthbacteria bacterium]|nr:50S ribosomal protein L19 [Candidatus Wildermuthbacteria bacterium]
MTDVIKQFSQAYEKQNLPDITSGDTVRVHQRVKEGEKTRIQIFEGVVLAHKHGKGVDATVTVRKISQGVGVERIFPLHSPLVEKFEVVKHAEVRRAKLYYLRAAKGKRARLKAKELGLSPKEQKEDIAPQE